MTFLRNGALQEPKARRIKNLLLDRTSSMAFLPSDESLLVRGEVTILPASGLVSNGVPRISKLNLLYQEVAISLTNECREQPC